MTIQRRYFSSNCVAGPRYGVSADRADANTVDALARGARNGTVIRPSRSTLHVGRTRAMRSNAITTPSIGKPATELSLGLADQRHWNGEIAPDPMPASRKPRRHKSEWPMGQHEQRNKQSISAARRSRQGNHLAANVASRH
jgi:hypothetical protein